MQALIRKYFPHLTPRQWEQIDQLAPLYALWNAQINVISRKDIDQLYERHVLHSLAIARAISFAKGTRVLDVGTGGGFPGIPLAILFPEASFTLVDSIGKKIKVVKEIAGALQLHNVTAMHERAEKVPGDFHFVVSRAVTEFPVLYSWVRKKFSSDEFNALRNGLLCLKGGDLAEELGSYFSRCTITPLSTWFSEPFFETKSLVYCPAR